MKHILALLAAFLLVSCATTAGFQRLCTSWVGQSEQSLLMSWGSPVNVAYTNGGKVITFRQSGQYITPTQTNVQTNAYGQATYDPYGAYASGSATTRATTTGGQVITFWCETSFFIDSDGTVVQYSFRGNNCVADE